MGHRGKLASYVAAGAVAVLAAASAAAPGQKLEKPDLSALKKVPLGKRPTKADAAGYVREILNISRGQRQFFASDPQVQMIAAVGPENVDVLLDVTKEHLPWLVYTREAIKLLARDEHKGLILGALPGHTPLIDVVIAKGWAKDPEAKKAVCQVLADRRGIGYFPVELIRTAASYQDPGTYEDLKNALVTGMNKYTTYLAIKDLPGIDLSSALIAAWEKASLSRGERDAGWLTPLAVERGHRPALDFAFETLDDNFGIPPNVYSSRRTAMKYTEAYGDNEELRRWYRENRSRLVYEEAGRRFRLGKR